MQVCQVVSLTGDLQRQIVDLQAEVTAHESSRRAASYRATASLLAKRQLLDSQQSQQSNTASIPVGEFTLGAQSARGSICSGSNQASPRHDDAAPRYDGAGAAGMGQRVGSGLVSMGSGLVSMGSGLAGTGDS